MKTLVLAVMLSAGLTAPAIAAETKVDAKVEVVERNGQGKATKVRIDGKIYEVCMSDASDGCINPRAAGLNFGDYPLEYWPGKSATDKG